MMPNLMYLAPTTVEELESSIRYGVEHHNHPIAIRIPVGLPIYETSQSNTTGIPPILIPIPCILCGPI